MLGRSLHGAVHTLHKLVASSAARTTGNQFAGFLCIRLRVPHLRTQPNTQDYMIHRTREILCIIKLHLDFVLFFEVKAK